ncbi:MAG: hypothetical protein SFX73_01865 [Kofleriaceae bacterium]|nr:hypothetical protein [Kofleriaceae bacterium]
MWLLVGTIAVLVVDSRPLDIAVACSCWSYLRSNPDTGVAEAQVRELVGSGTARRIHCQGVPSTRSDSATRGAL